MLFKERFSPNSLKVDLLSFNRLLLLLPRRLFLFGIAVGEWSAKLRSPPKFAKNDCSPFMSESWKIADLERAGLLSLVDLKGEEAFETKDVCILFLFFM